MSVIHDLRAESFAFFKAMVAKNSSRLSFFTNFMSKWIFLRTSLGNCPWLPHLLLNPAMIPQSSIPQLEWYFLYA